MGFRYRKTVELVPGLKLNVSGGGVSLSVGAPGATVNIGKHGVYATAGIPGTGLSFRQRLVSAGCAGSSENGSSALGTDPDTLAVAETMASAFRESASLKDLWYAHHSVTAEQAPAYWAGFLRTKSYPRKRVLLCTDGVKRSLSPEAFAIAGLAVTQDIDGALALPADPLDGQPDYLREQAKAAVESVQTQLAEKPELRGLLLSTTKDLCAAQKSYGMAMLRADKIVDALQLKATPNEGSNINAETTEKVLALTKARLAWELVCSVRTDGEREMVDRIHSDGMKTATEEVAAQEQANIGKFVLVAIIIIVTLAMTAFKTFR